MLVSFGGSEIGPVTRDTRNRGVRVARVRLQARRVGTVIVARTRKISLMDIVDYFARCVLCMREVSP
jgi:hypothetical protein